MDPQCEAHQKKIDEISKDTKWIRKILTGNGDVGICEQVRNHDNFISKFKKRRYDLSNVVYRTLIAGAIIYIMAKVGLK